MNYNKPDDHFIINDDKSLTPIKVFIEPIIKKTYALYNTPYYKPPIEKMDGYGKKLREQKFTLPITPQKLINVERNIKKKLEQDKETAQTIQLEIIRYINENKKEYKHEINWIATQWYYRLFGYWFICNGTPTYITGFHYSYLTTWRMGASILPEYRDVDRRSMLFDMYLYTCTETFANLDDEGFAIPEPDGSYKMKNLKVRTFYGSASPKARQRGSTHMYLSMGYDIITILKGSGCIMGICSFDAANALSQFATKLVPSFKKKPFYFKPIWTGFAAPSRKISFNAPGTVDTDFELESHIDPSDTASRKYYDGRQLYYVLVDESGKTQLVDIAKEHDVLKPCVSQGAGANIHGYMTYPSTVEEMNTGGGAEFYSFCKASDYYNRNKVSGQTKTGLSVCFMPAWDGLPGFIGYYGESVIDSPTPEQAEFIGRDVGSKQFLESNINKLLQDKTPDGINAYRSYIRKYPMKYDDCWLGNTGEIGFDILKIDAAISRINNLRQSPIVRGNFHLIGTLETGHVIFREEPNGRWEVSKLLKDGQHNKRIKKMIWDYQTNGNVSRWHPDRPKFVISGDAYKFNDSSTARVEQSRNAMSDGGGAIFELRDKQIDPDDKDISEWETYNLVATYQYRHSERVEYAKDMLYASIYYGAPMYPEMNVEYIWEYFCLMGFHGYMLYGNDTEGNRNAKPGFYSQKGSKDGLFNATRDFIYNHAHRVRHKPWLEDCKNIKDTKDMTNYDRFTAVGGCLLALECLSVSYMTKVVKMNDFTLDDMFMKR